MNWSKLKGKVIKSAELTIPSEVIITFIDGSSLVITSGEGHEEMITDVTSDWVFDPLDIYYREKE